MARTKQTSRQSTSGPDRSSFPRAKFGSARKPKKRKPRERKRWMSMTQASSSYGGWEYDSTTYRMVNGLNHYMAPHDVMDVIDLSVDEMGHDELDDEVMLGSIRGNIVGIQYYSGTVNNNEMVALEREPYNKYDRNAIKVTNVDRVQVGHIKRDLAKPLAEIIDQNLARPEGVVPFGARNMYSMPIDISLWGKPENQLTVMSRLRNHGFNGYMPEIEQRPSTSAGMGMAPIRRTFLSPSEIKNELDRLFENLQEGDKSSTSEPAKAISTPMYTHQKQALNWMIQREKGSHLPPFWEERNGKFFNSVTVFTSNQRPKSVKGGILADDMGLGKTLEMIALIVTHFKEDKPLAVPVRGPIRKSKELRAFKKEQMMQEAIMETKPTSTYKKIKLKFGDGDASSSQLNHGPMAKTLSNRKVLGLCPDPNLPSDEEESTETEEESDCDTGVKKTAKKKVSELGDAGTCMLKKEDPEYLPEFVKDIKENLSPGKSARRPRREVKRPARYVESSGSEDEMNDLITPQKKSKQKKTDTAYHPPTGKGKGVGKKGKKKLVLKPDPANSVQEADDLNMDDSAIEQPVVTPQALETIQQATVEDKPQITEILPKTEDKEIKTEVTDSKEEIKEDCLTMMLKSLDLMQFKEIFDQEQITLDILVEMGHEDLKSIGITAFGHRHKIMKATAKFVADAISKKTVDEKVKTEQLGDVKTEAKESECKPSKHTFMDCDDLPDPSENKPTGFNLETDPLDDLEELGSQLSSSEYGEGTGRTDTTGPRSTLIICPLSVLNNWLDQLEDHVHGNVHLDVYTYYGQSRSKDPKILSQQDIVLTTYSTVTADSKGNANPLQKIEWLRIVLDEGHAIRNPNAQQTKAICSLKAERKWILTGTPIQNSMKDLWSLVNFLQISPFTDKQWWNRAIERPLNDGNENALKRVQHLMGAISMRRTKTMKINNKPIVELPERNVFIEHVKLSEEERQVYEAMQKEGKIIVSRYFNQGTLLHNYGDVLAILMRLRQMCCHPLLVAKAAAAVKETIGHLEPGQAIPDDLREKLVSKLLLVLGSGSDEECAICLDGLKEPVITHCAHVFCKRCIDAVIQSERPVPRCPLCRGNVNADRLLVPTPEELHQHQQSENEQTVITSDSWKSSTKVDALINALVKLRQEDPTVKSLVVSQFTSLLSLIEIPLKMNGFNFVRLDGTMSLKQRHAAIEQLGNTAPGAPTIMLLSLTAGGVGINLTAASRVFLMDPAWNPATEDQCFDRCHRLGQTRDVIITKFIVDDSVEGRMMDLQEKKRTLMKGAFGKKQTAEEKRNNRIKDIKALMDL